MAVVAVFHAWGARLPARWLSVSPHWRPTCLLHRGIVGVSWHLLLPSWPGMLSVLPQVLFICPFWVVLFACRCMGADCSLWTDHLPALCICVHVCVCIMYVHIYVYVCRRSLLQCVIAAVGLRCCCCAVSPLLSCFATVVPCCHCRAALPLLYCVATVMPYCHYFAALLL